MFKIFFEDSVQWAARVGRDSNNWKHEERAIENFQHIKQQFPGIRAPNLFSKAEHPVVYSEWVDGEPPASWNSQILLIKRQRLLDDLAEFLLQLWTTPVPPTLVPAQALRYSVWLTKSLGRCLRRTLTGTVRWGNAIDCLIMRSMIPNYAVEFDKYTGVGLPHGDLNAHNIILT